MLCSLTIKNLLSFSPEGCTIPLRALNVLVGPNGVGKSNLLEIVALLRALPTGIHEPLQRGGALEWFHNSEFSLGASVQYHLDNPQGIRGDLLGEFHLFSNGAGIFLESESLQHANDSGASILFERSPTQTVLSRRGHTDDSGPTEVFFSAKREMSVLERFRDPARYFLITSAADFFSEFFFFRNWSFGPANRLRRGIRADEVAGDFLAEDASNLANVLHELRLHPEAWAKVIEALHRLYAGCDDIHVSFTGGVVQFFILEGEKKRKVPASRLSDGTLRYLALVAMLCHPAPPPLLCIEEPELGLHPDLMPTLAELLQDASTRTQIIVTTHSEALIDALSDTPEDVVVCEPGEDGTELRRLDGEALKEWLQRYKLGQLWRRGDIGGNRW